MNKINFDKEKYYSLKLSYEKAVSEDREQFVWENNLFLVSYAKYLLQHLENVLDINEKIGKK